jgi:hypothetical protein
MVQVLVQSARASPLASKGHGQWKPPGREVQPDRIGQCIRLQLPRQGTHGRDRPSKPLGSDSRQGAVATGRNFETHQCFAEGAEGAIRMKKDTNWSDPKDFVQWTLNTASLLRHVESFLEDHPKVDPKTLRIFSKLDDEATAKNARLFAELRNIKASPTIVVKVRSENMGYNIDRWLTKKLDNLRIPLNSFDPKELKWEKDNVVHIGDENDEGLYVAGKAIDGIMHVSAIRCCSENSNYDFHHKLLPALVKSKGELEAVMIWEHGDSITSLVVKDGIYRHGDIEL